MYIATIFLIRCLHYVHYVQATGSFSKEICVYDYVVILAACAMSLDMFSMEMTESVLLHGTEIMTAAFSILLR